MALLEITDLHAETAGKTILKGLTLGVGEDLLVAARPPADDIADRGEEVTQRVRAHHDVGRDHAQIGGDAPAVDRVGRGLNHAVAPFPLGVDLNQ